MRLAALLVAACSAAAAQTVCTFSISPTAVNVPARGPSPDGSSSGVVQITASSGSCPRTSTSNVEWITISFGSPGTGSGTTGYTVRQNTSPFPRTGTLNIAGQIFTVNQAAAVCSFQLSASAVRFPPQGGAATLSIGTSCSWTVSADADWIVIPGNNSGLGNGSVSFNVQSNPAAQERSARIRVGEQSVLITQAAAGCSIALNPTGANLPASGGSGTVEVSTPAGCSWTAESSTAWIVLTAGGNVRYTVSPNNTPVPRTATINIGGAIFTVTQAASSCAFIISPPAATVPAAVTQGIVQVTTTCEWTTSSNTQWIAITSGSSGAGNGTVSYTVAANPSSQSRTGTLTIGGITFQLTQQGAACSFSIDPVSLIVPDTGFTGAVAVAASADCSWTASSNVEWIRILATTRSGNTGTVNYSVEPNLTEVQRTGTLTIAGLTFTVIQAEPGPEISAAGVVNAASFLGGPLAPGEIVTLFGLRLGPETLATLQLTEDGQSLATALAGTRILFDDTAAPIVYVSARQLSAIVPYGAAGKASTRIQVDVHGRRSNAVTLPVVPAAPGIFTIDASGRGPGAILNQDYSVNAADNPAARGSVVMIFCTGEGATDPPGVDGRLTGAELARPKLEVAVKFAGISARVLYAGSAPGLVAGVLQINALIDDSVVPGDEVPVSFSVGGQESQPGVTLAVR